MGAIRFILRLVICSFVLALLKQLNLDNNFITYSLFFGFAIVLIIFEMLSEFIGYKNEIK